MMAAWGDSSDENDESQDEEAELALMEKNDSEIEDDEVGEESLSHLKSKVHGLSKAKLEDLLLTLMNEFDDLNFENSRLKENCSALKRNNKTLERNKQELIHANEILIVEKGKLELKALSLNKEVHELKCLLSTKENAQEFESLRLENENLDLKSQLENSQCKVKDLGNKLSKTISELAENRKWNSSSMALDWLNSHHNRSKKGLGFVKKQTVWPNSRKYVSLLENILCYHCNNTEHYRHYRHTCLREIKLLNEMSHLKVLWVRKAEIKSVLNRKGPKWIWVPKSNPRLTFTG